MLLKEQEAIAAKENASRKAEMTLKFLKVCPATQYRIHAAAAAITPCSSFMTKFAIF